MCGAPPPWAWRADTGYLPPANGFFGAPAVPMYGAAPNPNIFFDHGDGPPGPIPPMQFGAAVATAPPVVAYSPPPVIAASPAIPVVICHVHHCPYDACGCMAPVPRNPNARYGIHDLRPVETTIMEVYWNEEVAWGDDVTITSPYFRIFNVDCSWKIEDLLKNLMKARCAEMNGPDSAEGWAITEYTEKGGGRFGKGSSFKFGEDRTKNSTLTTPGWTTRRGFDQPPVKCQLHKA